MLHLKRMLFLEEAKKKYLQDHVNTIFEQLSTEELMKLYQQVCEASHSHTRQYK